MWPTTVLYSQIGVFWKFQKMKIPSWQFLEPWFGYFFVKLAIQICLFFVFVRSFLRGNTKKYHKWKPKKWASLSKSEKTSTIWHIFIDFQLLAILQRWFRNLRSEKSGNIACYTISTTYTAIYILGWYLYDWHTVLSCLELYTMYQCLHFNRLHWNNSIVVWEVRFMILNPTPVSTITTFITAVVVDSLAPLFSSTL